MYEPFKFLCEVSKLDTNECILWPYSLGSKGYGQIRFEGRTRRAHNLMLELFGPEPNSPEHCQAAHLPVVCHSKTCINLRHLYWATNSQNQRDRNIDGTHGNGSGKLTLADAEAIKDLLAKGISNSEIARTYAVDRHTIGDIKAGRSWA